MNLSPHAPVPGTVLLALPFPFAKELDACVVHQQVQRRCDGLVAQRGLQRPLLPADRAEVRYRPLLPGQLQQAVEHAQRLPQGLNEHAFDAQAELDGRVRERRGAPALAVGRSPPQHVLVQPHRERPPALSASL